jgi:polyisoprenoid-binding protein YceI
MTVTTLTRSLPAGRWLVDGRGSQLGVTVRVGGWATVCGRFTQVRGHVDVGVEPGECAVVAEIATASLSSGSRYWDRVLAAAGLVDTTANPLLRYRSTSVHPDGDQGWRVDGVLDTRGGAEPLAFALAGPATTSDGSARFRARGELPTTVAAALLGRAEAAALLGPTLALDLQVRVRPPGS